ncbi:MAG: hypothetical protein ABWZ82_10970, partial [Candidatus Limnocylindrales bacterium]
MRLTTPRTWMRRGIAAALTAGMVVPVGVAPVIAAVELDLATVYAGAEAIDDGGSDQCERDFTTSAQCSAARSGSRQGATGSGSGAVEAVLDHDGSDLVLISASGSYGGRATPTEEDGAYGEGSAGLQVRFEVLSPTIARITGSLRTTNSRDVACTQLAIL